LLGFLRRDATGKARADCQPGSGEDTGSSSFGSGSFGSGSSGSGSFSDCRSPVLFTAPE
jgi:hypothetical protein